MSTRCRPAFAFSGVALALCVASTSAVAQASCGVRALGAGQTLSCTATTSASMTVVPVAQLVLTSASTNIAGAAGGVTVASYDAGLTTGIVVLGPAFTVSSNKGVNVTLVNARTFTSPAFKSADDVDISIAAGAGTCGSTWTTLSRLPVPSQQANPLSLMNSATGAGGVTNQLCFRVRWSWTVDGPGNYTLPLTISVTAP